MRPLRTSERVAAYALAVGLVTSVGGCAVRPESTAVHKRFDNCATALGAKPVQVTVEQVPAACQSYPFTYEYADDGASPVVMVDLPTQDQFREYFRP